MEIGIEDDSEVVSEIGSNDKLAGQRAILWARRRDCGGMGQVCFGSTESRGANEGTAP